MGAVWSTRLLGLSYDYDDCGEGSQTDSSDDCADNQELGVCKSKRHHKQRQQQQQRQVAALSNDPEDDDGLLLEAPSLWGWQQDGARRRHSCDCLRSRTSDASACRNGPKCSTCNQLKLRCRLCIEAAAAEAKCRLRLSQLRAQRSAQRAAAIAAAEAAAAASRARCLGAGRDAQGDSQPSCAAESPLPLPSPSQPKVGWLAAGSELEPSCGQRRAAALGAVEREESTATSANTAASGASHSRKQQQQQQRREATTTRAAATKPHQRAAGGETRRAHVQQQRPQHQQTSGQQRPVKPQNGALTCARQKQANIELVASNANNNQISDQVAHENHAKRKATREQQIAGQISNKSQLQVKVNNATATTTTTTINSHEPQQLHQQQPNLNPKRKQELRCKSALTRGDQLERIASKDQKSNNNYAEYHEHEISSRLSRRSSKRSSRASSIASSDLENVDSDEDDELHKEQSPRDMSILAPATRAGESVASAKKAAAEGGKQQVSRQRDDSGSKMGQPATSKPNASSQQNVRQPNAAPTPIKKAASQKINANKNNNNNNDNPLNAYNQNNSQQKKNNNNNNKANAKNKRRFQNNNNNNNNQVNGGQQQSRRQRASLSTSSSLGSASSSSSAASSYSSTASTYSILHLIQHMDLDPEQRALVQSASASNLIEDGSNGLQTVTGNNSNDLNSGQKPGSTPKNNNNNNKLATTNQKKQQTITTASKWPRNRQTLIDDSSSTSSGSSSSGGSSGDELPGAKQRNSQPISTSVVLPSSKRQYHHHQHQQQNYHNHQQHRQNYSQHQRLKQHSSHQYQQANNNHNKQQQDSNLFTRRRSVACCAGERQLQLPPNVTTNGARVGTCSPLDWTYARKPQPDEEPDEEDLARYPRPPPRQWIPVFGDDDDNKCPRVLSATKLSNSIPQATANLSSGSQRAEHRALLAKSPLLQAPPTPSDSFTVMSYNVLSDRMVSTERFPKSPLVSLSWTYRRQLILDQLLESGADIIAVQELELDQFETYFLPQLAQLGNYDGLFEPKSRARTMDEKMRRRVDGCAIFYKFNRFKLIQSHLLEFNQIAMANAQGSEAMLNRVMTKDNIGLAAILEFRNPSSTNSAALSSSLLRQAASQITPLTVATGSEVSNKHNIPIVDLKNRILVCNTHIHWDPEHCDVKLIQTIMLMNELRCIARHHVKEARQMQFEQQLVGLADESVDDSTMLPLILLGDFNSLPQSGVSSFLIDGQINSLHEDFKQFKYTKCSNALAINRFDDQPSRQRLDATSANNSLRRQSSPAWCFYSAQHNNTANENSVVSASSAQQQTSEFNRSPASPSAASTSSNSSSSAYSSSSSSLAAAAGATKQVAATTNDLEPARNSPPPQQQPPAKQEPQSNVLSYDHPFDLASAYEANSMPYTNYTTKFKATIDYIYYSRDSLQLLGRLAALDISWLRGHKIKGLPQPHLPSDHLPLLVRLRLRASSPAKDDELAPSSGMGGDESAAAAASGQLAPICWSSMTKKLPPTANFDLHHHHIPHQNPHQAGRVKRPPQQQPAAPLRSGYSGRPTPARARHSQLQGGAHNKTPLVSLPINRDNEMKGRCY